jgi:hypothetical protein
MGILVMIDYSEMSDFEINNLTGVALGHDIHVSPYDTGHKSIIKDDTGGRYFDPVSSDSDCMPIAWENGISVMSSDFVGVCGWQAEYWAPKKHGFSRAALVSINKNPRRAICECFLMMKAAE